MHFHEDILITFVSSHAIDSGIVVEIDTKTHKRR